MIKIRYISALTFFCAIAALADDEVKLQAKSYSGRKLDDRSYNAKEYRVEKREIHRRYTASQKENGGFWSFFGIGRRAKGKILPAEHLEPEDYHPDSQLSLRVAHPEDKRLAEQRRVGDTPVQKGEEYKPTDKKPGRNPLLAPRQGIKAPVVKKEE